MALGKLAPKPAQSRSEEATVITATLKRGRHYVFHFNGKHHEFKRAIPEVVSKELADELEALTDVIRTDDDEEVEKDIFEIDRHAPTRSVVKPLPKKRLRLVEVEDDEDEAPQQTRKAGRSGPPGLYGRKIGG